MSGMESDPLDILRSLTATDIESRLDRLAQDEAALRTLLRAARAREREARRREQAAPRPEVARA